MRSLWIAVNIIKRNLKSKRELAIYLLVPCLIITLLLSFVGDNEAKVIVHYVNEDRGSIGEQVVRLLGNKDGYVLREIGSAQELRNSIKDRTADDGFVIPSDYTERLLAGSPASIPVYYLSLSETSSLLEINLGQIAGQVFQTAQLAVGQTDGSSEQAEPAAIRILERLAQRQIGATVTDQNLYVSPVLYLATGMLLMFMMYFMSHTVNTVLEDRQSRTLARLYAAPVRRIDITLGYFLGSWAAGTLQILFVILVTRYLVGFEYGLGFWPQFLMLQCFLLTVLGLAAAIAGLMRNSNNIGALSTFVVTPSCMLGGCWWPLDIMPEFMQKVANFMPQKWAIEGINLMAAGNSVADVGLHFVILVLAGIALLGFGSVILRPQDAEAA